MREAYATFRHDAVCPLVQTGPNTFILELFHGPTLAFKDVAMQLLARLMDHVLGRARSARDDRRRHLGRYRRVLRSRPSPAATAPTSSSSFPHGRVSPVQQRQMTTSTAANVHALAIEGNFDDCQGLVKDMFNDHGFRDRVSLSGVNSINWARIMAQIVYYFSSALSLGAPDRPVSFTVPTGNFGDIFAGYAAKRMGLPIERLVIATNDNDILARTLETGDYETRGVVATTSPSMDIQVSSNFERLLFEAAGRDAAHRAPLHGRAQAVRLLRDRGGATGERMRAEFAAGRADDGRSRRDDPPARSRRTGYLLDPHTATGIHVADKHGRVRPCRWWCLAPRIRQSFRPRSKQPAAYRPALPAWLADLMAAQGTITRCFHPT